MKIFILCATFAIIVILVACSSTSGIYSEKAQLVPNDSIGYNKLSLKISKISTVENIFDSRYTYTPKEGNRYVLVVIDGVFSKDMDIILKCKDFKAQSGTDTITATAINTFYAPKFSTVDMWAVDNSSITYSRRKNDSFAFIICFSLKKEISRFELRCRDYMAGTVEIK
jgi:hypothetical protein